MSTPETNALAERFRAKARAPRWNGPRTPAKPLPLDLLQKLFTLDEQGRLFWRERPLSEFTSVNNGKMWNFRYANKQAGGVRNGYVRVFITGIGVVLAHRVVYMLHHRQELPPDLVLDHINGERADNRPENLRLVTPAENARNRTRLLKTNKSGIAGVHWNSQLKKWCAEIYTQDKGCMRLGRFEKKEDAAAAVATARKEYNERCPI